MKVEDMVFGKQRVQQRGSIRSPTLRTVQLREQPEVRRGRQRAWEEDLQGKHGINTVIDMLSF